MSDNPDKQEWPTLRWPDAAEVIGEVKWAARDRVKGGGGAAPIRVTDSGEARCSVDEQTMEGD